MENLIHIQEFVSFVKIVHKQCQLSVILPIKNEDESLSLRGITIQYYNTTYCIGC